MSTSAASSYSTRPRKIWWLVAAIVLMVCILIQMPALWLVNQFMPNSPYLQQVSGNIWQGSAVLKMPTATTSVSSQSLSGVVTWHWQPLRLFLGKLGANIELTSGKTQLHGDVNRGFSSWQISGLSGKIDRQTLASLVNWQLPDAPIQVNGLSMKLGKDTGFTDVDGQLTWVGGELGYPSGGKTYDIALPAMRADLSQESRNGSEVIHANLVDNNSKRLGDFYLDGDGMLDVNLTQRLLENMPSYTGSAPADTAVVSVRQPLFSGMGSSAARRGSAQENN